MKNYTTKVHEIVISFVSLTIENKLRVFLSLSQFHQFSIFIHLGGVFKNVLNAGGISNFVLPSGNPKLNSLIELSSKMENVLDLDFCLGSGEVDTFSVVVVILRKAGYTSP